MEAHKIFFTREKRLRVFSGFFLAFATAALFALLFSTIILFGGVI